MPSPSAADAVEDATLAVAEREQVIRAILVHALRFPTPLAAIVCAYQATAIGTGIDPLDFIGQQTRCLEITLLHQRVNQVEAAQR